MRRKMKYKQNKEKSLLQYPDLINRKFNDIKTRFSAAIYWCNIFNLKKRKILSINNYWWIY
ncbi:hypothetical protein [Spiroplasma endosymbiont of Phyllotreta cruciferae]|uniref:hypothetical protein n=1 Tax=Spiroplasma endosymbiont of Phyllotreta cruciferae TaxID=2886375 RepID=UPI00209CFF77|nr:hypothetical protein [Spiroplasma endosymbiont of Phyllotreta cruciferae]